jgi:hypothetical protein
MYLSAQVDTLESFTSCIMLQSGVLHFKIVELSSTHLSLF